MTAYRYFAGGLFTLCCIMTIACASWLWLAMAAGVRWCLYLTEE